MSDHDINQLLTTIASVDETLGGFELDDEDFHNMLEEMRDKFARRFADEH